MIDLKAILHPTDFSDLSQCALPYAIEFATRYKAHLTILNVLELPFGAISMANEAVSEAERKLYDLIPEGTRSEIEVRPIVRRGKPFIEIIRVAQDLDIDLVVLATHGHSGLEQAVLGSTAEKVVRKAPCPVLTIRHPEHEFVSP
jgi:nucleotide-binding universal stress UspA family protein